jgi:hypothetical protein
VPAKPKPRPEQVQREPVNALDALLLQLSHSRDPAVSAWARRLLGGESAISTSAAGKPSDPER